MSHLHLQPLPAAAARAAATDARAYLAAHGNRDDISNYVRDVAAAQLALYERTGAAAPWIGYLAQDANGEIVGSCSFIVGQDPTAMEIAYYTFPPYEGRGIAKAMVARLVTIARAETAVTDLYAHTLPQENPATHILQELDFVMTDNAVDDETGPVWRWSLKL